MKNAALPLIILSLIYVLPACQKQHKLTPTERHLLGDWSFEKVKFQDAWSLGSDDITAEYDDVLITFNEDFTVTYVDMFTSEAFDGIWEVNVITFQESITHQLVASLTNPQTNEVKQIIWDNLSVTNRKIWSNNNTKEGLYTFKLIKV